VTAQSRREIAECRCGGQPEGREGHEGQFVASERPACTRAGVIEDYRSAVQPESTGASNAKPPGVAETIDWAMALNALGRRELDAAVVEQTLGSVLKYREDIDAVRDETLARLVDEARAAAAP
jgi:phage terminase large subunit-like protein